MMPDTTDTLQSDLRELLLVLGMGDHARPQSPHEVFQEALGLVRGRLVQGTDATEPPGALKAAIWQALLPFQNELLSTGGVTFMGLRNAVARAVEPFIEQHRSDAVGWHVEYKQVRREKNETVEALSRLREALGEPFLTGHSGCEGGPFVRLKYETPAEAQQAHEALVRLLFRGAA